MKYCEFSCDLKALVAEKQELLTVFLSEIGFESFMETDEKYTAYIQSDNFDKQALIETLEEAEPILGKFEYAIVTIPSQDWNTEWESSFQYAKINDEIIVRTPLYQPEKQYKYNIIIDPKMSFGSGTHETTSLILQAMSKMDFKGKSVADCGCGTGILGIFASMLGAKSVLAFDYDSCCVENTRTNIQLNNIANMDVQQAKLDILNGKKFDCILANINKNILIENMEFLANAVNENGTLILSGFYSEDVDDIAKSAKTYNLHKINNESKNNWTITTFKRK